MTCLLCDRLVSEHSDSEARYCVRRLMDQERREVLRLRVPDAEASPAWRMRA